MDKVSQEVRSRIMRSVRSTQNKSTEEKFKAALIEAGISGWEVRPDMKYKPDFIFSDQKIAIFIDGCFWHGCPTCANKKPATNKDYWTAKVSRNQKRDLEASEYLKAEGWTVFRVWEHQIKGNLDEAISQVAQSITPKTSQNDKIRANGRKGLYKMTASQNASLESAKERLDRIIAISRTDLYKPIQIAEFLYHSRLGEPNIDVRNLETYRISSRGWRDYVCERLLKKASTSSMKFQDNIWESNAMTPELLAFLDEENNKTGGAVEKYIYLRFQERQEAVGSIISAVEAATPETFDVASLFDVFEKNKAVRRSIDKVYEVVVYSLMETIVVELGTMVTVSVPPEKNPILTEFSDIAKLLFGISNENYQHTLPAHVYRAGVANAADRGLDMWANFGPTIQVKHLTLNPKLAEKIVNQIDSDNIIVVCKKADRQVIEIVMQQISWGSKVRDIVTEVQLAKWYNRCLREKYADLLAQKLLDKLSIEFKKEFVRATTIGDFLEEREYLKIPSPHLWSVDILKELKSIEDETE